MSKGSKSISDKSWCYTNCNRKTSSNRENLLKGSKSISDKSWCYTNSKRKTSSKRENLSNRKALNPSAIRAGLTLILTEKLVLNGKTWRKALNPSAIKAGATLILTTTKNSYKREKLSKGTESISDKSWCFTNFNRKTSFKRENLSNGTKSISEKSWCYTNLTEKLVLNGKTRRKALNPSAIKKTCLTLMLTEKLVLNGEKH